MTTLVKCRFCLRNGHNEVSIPDGEPVKCAYCRRVQPVAEKPREMKTSIPATVVRGWFDSIKSE